MVMHRRYMLHLRVWLIGYRCRAAQLLMLRGTSPWTELRLGMVESPELRQLCLVRSTLSLIRVAKVTMMAGWCKCHWVHAICTIAKCIVDARISRNTVQ